MDKPNADWTLGTSGSSYSKILALAAIGVNVTPLDGVSSKDFPGEDNGFRAEFLQTLADFNNITTFNI
jgi:hypothetical protein